MSTVTKLLDAAESRMRRGGYNSVSFRDLASDMQIKSSSVHYHFPTKEHLGAALIERYGVRFFEILAESYSPDASCEEKLVAFAGLYRAALVTDDAHCLCGVLGAEMGCLPETMTVGIQHFFKQNIDWVAGVLNERLSPEKAQAVASSFVAGLQGGMMLANSTNDHELFDTICTELTSMALNQ